jgi:hypothetical protein
MQFCVHFDANNTGFKRTSAGGQLPVYRNRGNTEGRMSQEVGFVLKLRPAAFRTQAILLCLPTCLPHLSKRCLNLDSLAPVNADISHTLILKVRPAVFWDEG